MVNNASFRDPAGKSVFLAGDFLADMKNRHGTPPLFVQGDITNTDQLLDAVRSVAQAHGPIDILVNNAANDDRHTLDDVTEDYWDQMMAINLKAYFFACQEAARQMASGGVTINFSSISYMMGNGGYPAYTSANAGLTPSLAREPGPRGIRVNAIAPGWVLTQKQLDQLATPKDLAAHLDRQCLKDHQTPADIVDPVLFLASKASRMMFEQCMVVDGGVVVSK